MNLTHLHLMITHLPIFGSILGALVLIYGMMTHSQQARTAAFLVILVSAIGGIIAYSTGETAEESVEHIQGVEKSRIEEHEESGQITFFAAIAMGISSLAGIYINQKKVAYTKTIAIITLIISLACFGLASYTGYLGGQVRHTELTSGAAVPQQPERSHSD